jgi:hypothetical protein
MKYFTPKLMRIKYYLGIFTTFGIHFQTKLTIHNSILIHRVKIISTRVSYAIPYVSLTFPPYVGS